MKGVSDEDDFSNYVMIEYFVGCDDFCRAERMRAMISANALRKRKSPNIKVKRWMLDSGAFSQITQFLDFVLTPKQYVELAVKYQHNGDLACIVSQDYMCEPDVIAHLRENGVRASVRIHQKKTVARYIEIMDEAHRQKLSVPVMPVLQGWEPEDYHDHWTMYIRTLADLKYERCRQLWRNPFLDRPPCYVEQHIVTSGSRRDHIKGQWLGVGSTCKRNANPDIVSEILDAIPIPYEYYKVHAFGLKTTALKFSSIKDRLYSADSMAYDFADRYEGKLRDRESRANAAVKWGEGISHNKVQMDLNLNQGG